MSNNTRPQPVNNDNKNSKAQAQRPPIRRGGGPGALIPGEKARDFKGSMRHLIRYLGKYRWLILFTMLLAAGSTVFSIFGPPPSVRQPRNSTLEFNAWFRMILVASILFV